MKKVLLISLTITINAFGCTGLFLKNASGGYTYARTLEFGQDLQSQILFIPRNYNFAAPSPVPNQGGLKWVSKYAVVGANAFGLTNFVDGINEKGLAGGLFYFPGFAEYQEVPVKSYDKSLPMWQLLTWILTTFATVTEVKNALPTIYVSKAVLPGTNEVIPAHLVVHDSQGNSVVIEYVKGALTIHENPLGVITNSPTFDWHMTNLRNYINLSPINMPDKKMAGVTFSPLSQGTGMLGLPGDFTSPSRFARITAFTQAAPQEKTELDGIHQAFHILNNFDIPKGCVMDSQGTIEFTLWTSATDMKNKIFYFKPYDNFQPQKIELMKQQLDAKEHKIVAVKRQDSIEEIA